MILPFSSRSLSISLTCALLLSMHSTCFTAAPALEAPDAPTAHALLSSDEMLDLCRTTACASLILMRMHQCLHPWDRVVNEDWFIVRHAHKLPATTPRPEPYMSSPYACHLRRMQPVYEQWQASDTADQRFQILQDAVNHYDKLFLHMVSAWSVLPDAERAQFYADNPHDNPPYMTMLRSEKVAPLVQRMNRHAIWRHDDRARQAFPIFIERPVAPAPIPAPLPAIAANAENEEENGPASPGNNA